MIDPRTGIPLIQDAYAACQGGTIAKSDDLIFGRHVDGCEHLFGVVRDGNIGIRGTEIFGVDFTDWISDAIIHPVDTPFGHISAGVWGIYSSFRTQSGAPLSVFRGYGVHGHSLGAGLAAIMSVALQCEHVLWACPNWFGPAFGSAFAKLGGYVFAEAGDVVPLLPYPTPFNPRLGPVTHLIPPAGTNGLAAHHSFSTYVASYEAQIPNTAAA